MKMRIYTSVIIIKLLTYWNGISQLSLPIVNGVPVASTSTVEKSSFLGKDTRTALGSLFSVAFALIKLFNALKKLK